MVLATTAPYSASLSTVCGSFAPARRGCRRDKRTENKLSKTPTRDRNRPLKVLVTNAERTEIAMRAQATRLPVSAYLRALGLGYTPSSTLDAQAILALLKVNADQGRLGGLLKLWLSTRPGTGASVSSVRALLHDIETRQGELRRLIGRL